MKKKKRALTLLEIMIVIFLITLITGTIGYSMKGTMDKGRAFRTEQGRIQLHDLLLVCLAETNASADQIAANPVEHLKRLGMAKDPDKLVLDGWKKPFKIRVNRNKSDFSIQSEEWEKYKKAHKTPSEQEKNDDEQDNSDMNLMHL